MSAPTIDTATFRQLQENAGAEFVAELVQAFLEEAPKMMGDLRGAMAAGDAETFRRAAHSLKSNCNTFGATSLAAISKELELAGLDRVLASGADPLAALTQEYARVAQALAELRDA